MKLPTANQVISGITKVTVEPFMVFVGISLTMFTTIEHSYFLEKICVSGSNWFGNGDLMMTKILFLH